MSTSPFSSRTLFGVDLCLSLCEFIGVSALLFLEGLDSVASSFPSGSYVLSASYSAEFSEP